MNPWIIILLVTAVAVFAVDYLLRKKKWNENSRQEKISLLVNMFSVAPHIFLSVLGMFWGIVPGTPESAFGKILYTVTLKMGSLYFIVAVTAVILSIFLRKKGKAKASTLTNVAALLYITVVLLVNSIVGKIL